jgi:hypothetical protein
MGSRRNLHRRRLRGFAGNAFYSVTFWNILRLNGSPAFTPLRLAKITLTRIGPSVAAIVKDFAQFGEHFCSDPNAPASESFDGGSCRAFLFPPCPHCGNFQQVRMFNFCFGHTLIVTGDS